jgi:hypothetical protein
LFFGFCSLVGLVGCPKQACLAIARSRLTFLETWMYDRESSPLSLLLYSFNIKNGTIVMPNHDGVAASGGKIENDSTRTNTHSKKSLYTFFETKEPESLTFVYCSFSFLDCILVCNVKTTEVDQRQQS